MSNIISKLHPLTLSFKGSSEEVCVITSMVKDLLDEIGEPQNRKTDDFERTDSNTIFVVRGIEDAIDRDNIELIKTRCRFFLDYMGLGKALVKKEIDRGSGDFEVKSYFCDGGCHSFYYETSRIARSEARRWLESTVKTEVIHRPTKQIIGEYRPKINI